MGAFVALFDHCSLHEESVRYAGSGMVAAYVSPHFFLALVFFRKSNSRETKRGTKINFYSKEDHSEFLKEPRLKDLASSTRNALASRLNCLLCFFFFGLFFPAKPLIQVLCRSKGS